MNNNDQNNNNPTEQLRSYIQQQLNSGISSNEIYLQLKQASWQDDVIQHAFQLVQASIMPSFNQPSTTPLYPQEQAQIQPVLSEQIPSTKVKRGRFKTGWLLFKQSIRVLRQNEGLTRYVIMSFVISFLFTILYVVVFIFGKNIFIQGVVKTSSGSSRLSLKPLGYLMVFTYYVLTYFIINLYSAGLVANVIDIFHGQSQHYRNYMKVARSKGMALFIYAVIESTVGLILRFIAERSRLFGRIVVWIIGVAWSLSRLFVVPIIVTSEENPFIAIKHSTKLLVSTWGENLAGRVSFGVIGMILYLLVLAPISFGILFLGQLLGHGIGLIISVFFILILYLAFGILMSTASSVLNTALFYYAQYRQIPAAFDAQLINSAFINKKPKSFFGFRKK